VGTGQARRDAQANIGRLPWVQSSTQHLNTQPNPFTVLAPNLSSSLISISLPQIPQSHLISSTPAQPQLRRHIHNCRMLSRTLRKSFAAPLRRNAFAPIAAGQRPAFRTVTTDAASSHADRDSVPSVCYDSLALQLLELRLWWMVQLTIL